MRLCSCGNMFLFLQKKENKQKNKKKRQEDIAQVHEQDDYQRLQAQTLKMKVLHDIFNDQSVTRTRYSGGTLVVISGGIAEHAMTYLSS